MASAAQGGGGGSNNNSNETDLACVYRAVDQGASAEQVRAILAGGPRTRHAKEQWLAGVLNHKNTNGETALEAAHKRLRRGDLVGVLLEAGADARILGPYCNALALAIFYGEIETLRHLLRSGRHDANEKLRYERAGPIEGSEFGAFFCRAVHLAVVPPKRAPNDHRSPPSSRPSRPSCASLAPT
jgi:hypothetical protein